MNVVNYISVKLLYLKNKKDQSLNTRDPRKTISRHIVIKMATIKDMERVLKAAKEQKTKNRSAI